MLQIHLWPGSDDDTLGSLLWQKTSNRCIVIEALPYLFGNKWDEWMQESQQGIEGMCQHATRNGSLIGVFKTQLYHFNIEAAKLIPGKII